MTNIKSTKLVRVSLRLSPKHLTGLHALRADDGVSIQDHIRRALDNYLARPAAKLTVENPPAEAKITPPGAGLAEPAEPGVISPPARTRRKVVFR
jgi:hypothetical protein